MTELKWTYDLPDKEGFYWFDDFEDLECEVIEVFEFDNTLCYMDWNEDIIDVTTTKGRGMWSDGPIDPPVRKFLFGDYVYASNGLRSKTYFGIFVSYKDNNYLVLNENTKELEVFTKCLHASVKEVDMSGKVIWTNKAPEANHFYWVKHINGEFWPQVTFVYETGGKLCFHLLHKNVIMTLDTFGDKLRWSSEPLELPEEPFTFGEPVRCRDYASDWKEAIYIEKCDNNRYKVLVRDTKEIDTFPLCEKLGKF